MSAGPRLLWVNQFAVAPGDGGGTRHVEIARELVLRGWQVTIVASDLNLHSRRYTRRAGAADRRLIRENVDGVEILWAWSLPYERNDWRRAGNWLSFAWRVGRGLEGAERADVVLGSSPHLLAALAAERLARRWRVPFAFEVRDLWPESLEAAGGGRGAAYRAFDAIARRLYARAERVIVLARGTGEYLQRERGVPAGRIAYVPNGVDTAAFGGHAREPRADGLTLVYAGAHGPANGLEAVLGAADLLRGSPDIRFLLVGDGPAKDALREEAVRRGLPNVEFRPPVPKAEMARVLGEADAGLMVLKDAPLFSFGVSPNKLFDYFAAGLPVVCNVPGEVAGMVRDAGAGEQAADSTAAALADAVRRMAARSAEQRLALGRAGRAWVEREHARPILAERLEAALLPLVRP